MRKRRRGWRLKGLKLEEGDPKGEMNICIDLRFDPHKLVCDFDSFYYSSNLLFSY